jgi:hypothetical protein
MTSVDNNVTTFNEFVILQLDALTARGESSSDVMVILFKGYLAAPRQGICDIHQTKDEQL